MFCAEWSLVKHRHGAMTITPLRCNCWTCEECQPRRKARLIEEAQRGKPTIFITLTTWRRPGFSPDHAARELVEAWRIVRREYVKKNGKGSIPFLAVFEETKMGWPHLHIVARARWVDQRWLSNRMRKLIGAPIVDVRKVKGIAKVAAYVAKYIGKNPAAFKGTKRYWRSLDYLRPEDEPQEDEEDEPVWWRIERTDWTRLAKLYHLDGWDLDLQRDKAELTNPPWP